MLVQASSHNEELSLAGLTWRRRDPLLVIRARDFLAAGPASAQELIAAVCQLPGVPVAIAEHMTFTLLGDETAFRRDTSGRWELRAPARAVAGSPNLDTLSYAVVDVEATGGRPLHGDRITEIAAVLVRRGDIVEVFETLVNPRRSIPPWVTRLTNISWSMVKDAPPFEALCDKVLAALGGHIFVAHNARFDWCFINAEIERATAQTLDGPTLCTVRLARRLLPHLRRRSLDHVAHHFGVTIRNRHRAGGDAIGTARVLLQLLTAARERGCDTWHDLQTLLASAPPRRRRPRRHPATPQPVSRDTTA